MSKTEDGKSTHQSIKSLEDAVESFIADMEDRLAAMEKNSSRWSSLSASLTPLTKLKAALASHTGRAPNVPRKPYERTVSRSQHDRSVEERHESYGLLQINRVSGGRNLFGSSVQHQNYYVLQVVRGKRVTKEHGEHFWGDGSRLPIVEVAISPAQFVELITTQNIGSGVPCTIIGVEGVMMDPTPDDAGSEVKLIAEGFAERLEDAVSKLNIHDDQLSTMLDKKTFTKDDKEQIRAAVHAARRLMSETAPYIMSLMGEHTEKLMAKGRLEVESFIQLALTKAGIKSVRDNKGVLLLGSGDEPSTEEK